MLAKCNGEVKVVLQNVEPQMCNMQYLLLQCTDTSAVDKLCTTSSLKCLELGLPSYQVKLVDGGTQSHIHCHAT